MENHAFDKFWGNFAENERHFAVFNGPAAIAKGPTITPAHITFLTLHDFNLS